MLYITKDGSILEAAQWDGTEKNAYEIAAEFNLVAIKREIVGAPCKFFSRSTIKNAPPLFLCDMMKNDYLVKNPLGGFEIFKSANFEERLVCKLGNIHQSYYDLLDLADNAYLELEDILDSLVIAKDNKKENLRKKAKQKALELVGHMRGIFEKLLYDEKEDNEIKKECKND
jgi:hypothetical protein